MTYLTSSELVTEAIKISKLNTQYLSGGFGCRLGKDWYDKSYSWNKSNKALLESKYNTNPITYGFDCVCLFKSIIWNFQGNPDKAYGGAVYDKSTDYSVSQVMSTCAIMDMDFDNIEAGELVFLGKGHMGIYIGNGEVIEATPAWECKVQRTLLPSRNTTNYEKLPVRKWDCHGKCAWIDYESSPYKMAYEKLSQKYGELEAEIVRLNGQINKIKEILK